MFVEDLSCGSTPIQTKRCGAPHTRRVPVLSALERYLVTMSSGAVRIWKPLAGSLLLTAPGRGRMDYWTCSLRRGPPSAFHLRRRTLLPTPPAGGLPLSTLRREAPPTISRCMPWVREPFFLLT